MKIISPIPRKRGRIEIIPLIDIMFFLLAAFMMVSINEIRVKSLKVKLPTDVPVAQLEPKEDFISVSINTMGQVQIDKQLIKDPATELLPILQDFYAKNKDQKFLISADKDGRNGDVMAVLGKLRTAGFQNVAFALKGGTGGEASGSTVAPAPPESPAAPAAPTTPGAPPAAPAAPPAAAAAPAAPAATPPPAAPLSAPTSPATPATAPASPPTNP